MKNSLLDYTEQEFLDLLVNSYDDDFPDDDLDRLVYFFNQSIAHPRGSSLLTHPTIVGIEDSPEAIIAELKRWYTEQGKPCFKEDI
ncbi:bacteriocin immunity protein [Enterovibrio sp. ZSDZ42]|uniref:Bacteriocin immunity protein n=1 Tax=Enterovibrio gelatinilyticus TaxID=2899819 RepID=A0ABT5R0X2_9GAMM|nr:bacteriocin immunity protein [Enterovibrio sp. ZSDZ42]MDD1793922.1 bacteriocin immunity protein [Enterovibrio sp. ZSDZ42]